MLRGQQVPEDSPPSDRRLAGSRPQNSRRTWSMLRPVDVSVVTRETDLVTYPCTAFKYHAGEVHSRRRDMALFVLEETMVDKAELHEVLSKSAGLDVVVVCLGNSSQEVHRVGIAEIVLESRQGVSFGAEHFIDSEAIIRDMDEVAHVW